MWPSEIRTQHLPPQSPALCRFSPLLFLRQKKTYLIVKHDIDLHSTVDRGIARILKGGRFSQSTVNFKDFSQKGAVRMPRPPPPPGDAHDWGLHLDLTHNYFSDHFLRRSTSVSELGSIPWYLALSLLGAWILTCLLVFRGSKLFGIVSNTNLMLCQIVLPEMIPPNCFS
jgi:hypothetical protein